MTYEWVEHTAELELHVTAPSPELVFHDTMRAFGELVGAASGPEQEHQVELDAADRPTLLAEWLEELIFLAETTGFVPEKAEIEAWNTKLRATVRGRVGSPSPLVKAVTYHGLEFAERNGVWQARLVLDV